MARSASARWSRRRCTRSGDIGTSFSSLRGTITGANGRVSVIRDAYGAHVTYNGRFLYTFISDSAGHVTGQGVQDFFVATPGLSSIGAGSSGSTNCGPA